MGIFVIIASTGVVSVLGGFAANRLSAEETEAFLIAQEGIEAGRSLRNQGWDAPFLDTDCSTSCGITASSGSWSWSGSNNVSGKFTRTITVSPVQRNGSNIIVPSGGTNDPDTKQVKSAVTWNHAPNRANTVTLQAYLTNFIKAIGGDWSTPQSHAILNVGGNQDGWKVATAGNYAYVVSKSGSPNFLIIDISAPASPSIAGSLSLSGGPNNLVVSGDYAYVANSDNNEEVQVIQISNPTAPAKVGSADLSGEADAYGIAIQNSYVYVVRKSSGDNEFFVVNITTPTAPSALGSLDLGDNGNEVVVLGNTAYIATADKSAELMAVNISVPTAPTLTGILDLPDKDEALTIAGYGTVVVLGRKKDGLVHTISVATPSAPTELGSYTVGSDVEDISIDETNNLAFLATANNSNEFVVLNITTPSTPALLGSLNLNDAIYGVTYSSTKDVVVVVGKSNDGEIEVLGSS